MDEWLQEYTAKLAEANGISTDGPAENGHAEDGGGAVCIPLLQLGRCRQQACSVWAARGCGSLEGGGAHAPRNRGFEQSVQPRCPDVYVGG